jgi:tyrosyl-tRNA synthetase
MNKEKKYKSKEMQYLSDRGFLKQITHEDQLDERFLNEKITFYIGFDCTAMSLHIGHLIPLMITRYLVLNGHKAIIILGTTTAKIGDPSGKNQTRKMLSEEDIKNNFKSISKIIKNFLISSFSEETSGIKKENLVDNIMFLENNWLEKFSLVEFLRDFGSLFSVNQMIKMETFKNRLENHENLSFLEFTYSLFQAYDFYYLSKNFNCILQIGGSDQWGNIICGIDLGSKLLPENNFFGMTCNLLLNSIGQKMGKTSDGAVWLDKNMFSHIKYWQYFRNIDDADVMNIFNLLSDFSHLEINNFFKEKTINELKTILATNLTKICHGSLDALEAENDAKKKFELLNNLNSINPEEFNINDLGSLDSDFQIRISINLPTIEILNLKNNNITAFNKKDPNSDCIEILDILKICMPDTSNSELKKLIMQNAVKINNTKIQNYLEQIKKDSVFFKNSNKIFLQIGKKKRFIIEFLFSNN